jgi:apolipoprotein N-acyltransferase
MMALAWPPVSLWPLGWLSVLFLAFTAAHTTKRRELFWAFFEFGFWVNVFGFYWIAYTVHEFGNLPWVAAVPVMLLLSLLFGLQSGSLIWLMRRIVGARFSKAPWLFGSAFVLVLDTLEFRLFPWSFVQSVGSQPQLLAATYFLKMLGWRSLFFLSVALALWALSRRSISKQYAAAGVLGGFVLCMGTGGAIGLWAENTLKSRYAARQPVALFQGNVGNYEKKLVKLGFDPSRRNVLAIHTALQEELRLDLEHEKFFESNSELWVFWPETSFPGFPLAEDDSKDLLTKWAKDVQGLHILGAYEQDYDDFAGEQTKLDYNIVAMFSGGGFESRYRKRIRLPFGEYIPGDEWFPGLYKLLPAVNHFGKGKEFVGLPHPQVQGPVFLPLVCYEILDRSFVHEFVKSLRAKHPGRSLILVNPTNDSWYGPTSEQFQHALLARWTAVTEGLPLIRPTNTGLSLVIAPWGEVMGSGAMDESLKIRAELPVESLTARPN